MPAPCNFHLWLRWLLLRKQDLLRYLFSYHQLLYWHLWKINLQSNGSALSGPKRASLFLFYCCVIVLVCLCVCPSLSLSENSLCITKGFPSVPRGPSQLLHQHCPLPTLVLFFRTLSLCPVLWSYCSMHYLLC